MKQRFEVLDSFRGLCAIFVAVFHMTFVASFTELTFFRSSSVFVEFFFVLSGFVMSYGYMTKKNLSFKNFFIKRTFRIYPLHIFMFSIFIALELVLFYLYQNGLNIKGEPFSGKNGLSEIIPNLFLLQSWTTYTNKLSFNGPSWSISVEYYMYLIFFITLMYMSASKKYLPSIFIILISLVCYLSEQTVLTKSALIGLQCFFMGNITYLLYSKASSLRLKGYFFSVLEFISLLLVFCFVSFNLIDPKIKMLLSSVLFSVVVFVFAFEGGCLSKIFKHKFLVFLGLISYSIYLTHYFIVSMFKSLMVVLGKLLGIELTMQLNGSKYIDLGSPFLNDITAVFLLMVIIGVAKLTYDNIEIRGQKLGQKLLNKNLI